MNLNPAIVIPTYWCGRRGSGGSAGSPVYDYVTPVDQPGNLSRCLDSLQRVEGLGRVIVLVAAVPGTENQAAEKVREILGRYP